MISKTSIHAIRALTILAQLPEDTYIGTAAIAGQIGAPPNYLGKLLQTLVRTGLVTSQKGMKGGFRLARPATEISLLDVIEPIEHVSRWSNCILGNHVCSDEHHCAMHERWKTIRENYIRLLTDTTIADLAAHGEVPFVEP